MLAKQRAFFEGGETDEHDECVVTDHGSTCLSIEPQDGPDSFVPQPIGDERLRRSPGIANNFWDMSNEDFRKPWTGNRNPVPPANVVRRGPPANVPPPVVNDQRRARSPGIQNNFYEKSTADFKQPHVPEAAPSAPTGGSGAVDEKLTQLADSNDRLAQALEQIGRAHV